MFYLIANTFYRKKFKNIMSMFIYGCLFYGVLYIIMSLVDESNFWDEYKNYFFFIIIIDTGYLIYENKNIFFKPTNSEGEFKPILKKNIVEPKLIYSESDEIIF